VSGLAVRLDPSPDFLRALAELVVPLVLVELRRSEIGRAGELEYLTVSEAAEHVRAKPQRVYDLLSAGRLRRYKDGARVLVKRTELEAYLANGGARGATLLAPRHVAAAGIATGYMTGSDMT
jgi:excisionase family DNA binding protein